MSVTRDNNEVVFECDLCSETLETEESDWGEALAAMKAEGWMARKVGLGRGEFKHFCPDHEAEEVAEALE